MLKNLKVSLVLRSSDALLFRSSILWLVLVPSFTNLAFADTGETGSASASHVSMDVPAPLTSGRRIVLDEPADPSVALAWPIETNVARGESVTSRLGFDAQMFDAWTAPWVNGSEDVRIIDLRVSSDRWVEMHLASVEFDVRGGVHWVGTVPNEPFSRAMFTLYNNTLTGEVHTLNETWRVRTVDEETAVVTQLAPKTAEEQSCGSTTVESEMMSVSANVESGGMSLLSEGDIELPQEDLCNQDETGFIDVLFIITDGADDDFNLLPDALWGEMASYVAWANATFRASGLETTVRLVGVEQMDLAHGVSTPVGTVADAYHMGQVLDCAEDPSSCSLNITSPFFDLADLRDDYGADIVYILTDTVAVQEQDAACGAVPNPCPPTWEDADLVSFNDDIACADCEPAGLSHGANSEAYFDAGDECWRMPTGEFAMGLWSSGWDTFAHELGHLLGAEHGVWTCDASAPVPFGTSPWAGDNSAYTSPDCAWMTLMGRTACNPFTTPGCNQTCGENAVYRATCPNFASIPRIAWFGNPCARASDNVIGQVPQPTGDDDHENARIMEQASPYLASFRDPMVPLLEELQAFISSPAPFSDLASGGTITIDVDLPSGQPSRWVSLRVGTDYGGDQLGNFLFLAPDSRTFTAPTSGSTDRVFVRLATLVPTPDGSSAWISREVRYNWTGALPGLALLGCDATGTANANGASPLNGIVPEEFVFHDCVVENDTATNNLLARAVCSESTSSPWAISCSIDNPSTSLPPSPPSPIWLQAASRRGENDLFDHAFWGVAEESVLSGGSLTRKTNLFCCVYKDRIADPADSISFIGGQNADEISLSQCNRTHLRALNGPMTVEVQGNAGDDRIEGSYSTLNNYSETLRGNFGDDTIFGNAGDDEIWGNQHNDTIYSGKGRDFVYGGAGDDIIHLGPGDLEHAEGGNGHDIIQGGQGTDEIDGGADNDLLCDEQGADTLLGSNGADDLFWVQGSTSFVATRNGGNPATGNNQCVLPALTSDVNCTLHISAVNSAWDDCPRWEDE